MRIAQAFLAGVMAFSAGAALADPSPAHVGAASSAASVTKKAQPTHGTKAQAVAMVRRVEESFKKNGALATFKAISDPSSKAFHEGDLYPFVFTFKGICVAHGALPALVGKNLDGLKDPDGRYVIKDSARVALKGGGWYDYKWPDPKTHTIVNKSSYIQKLGTHYFVGVGIYRLPHAS